MSAEDETLNLNGENTEVTEETSSMFNYSLIFKILAALAVVYLIYTYYMSTSSTSGYTPAVLPINSGAASSSFDAVSTAFGH